MFQKHVSRKAVWAISLSLILVVVLLILVFAASSSGVAQEGIVLPSPSPEASEEQSSQNREESGFLEITNENVLTALQTLNRPAAYYQQYSVAVGTGDVQLVKNVHMWVREGLLRAEVRDDHHTKHLLTDGDIAYIWYDADYTPVSVKLSEQMSKEDLLGIPDFDGYLTIPAEMMEDSGYVFLEESQVPCIFVSSQITETESLRYWVNLNTGLLYQADALDASEQVYVVRQQSYEPMHSDDESFSERFRLPDQSSPFIAEEQTPQP